MNWLGCNANRGKASLPHLHVGQALLFSSSSSGLGGVFELKKVIDTKMYVSFMGKTEQCLASLTSLVI